MAISNQRLISIDDGKVSFGWKDYAHGAKRRVMTLEASEFIRRFLFHVLPKGFVRIRHYGFLSNRLRAEKLPLARKLIGTARSEAAADDGHSVDRETERDSEARGEEPRCPRCKQGRLIIVEELARASAAQRDLLFADTS